MSNEQSEKICYPESTIIIVSRENKLREGEKLL